MQRNQEYLDSFLFALKNTETKRQYSRNLKLFFDFGFESNISLQDQCMLFMNKARRDNHWTTNYFIQFLKYQIENRVNTNHITSATLKNYYKAAKLFCVMNDIILNWVKITKGLPKVKYYSDDRAPTIDEIRKLLEYPDRRLKPIIYTMASSGIRIGAWDYLKWKDIIPIYQKEKLVAAKIVVYSQDPERYFSFITVEAYNAIKDWMEYRSTFGENITGESWVMRDIWQTSERSYGASFGTAANPQQLTATGIKSLIERALHAQGMWLPLQTGKKRREWQGAHGFRKFFKTQAEQMMKTINVEFCMGHNSDKLQKSYYKPSEKEILDDYIKASDLFTINEESKLREEIKILKIEKSRLDRIEEKMLRMEQMYRK